MPHGIYASIVLTDCCLLVGTTICASGSESLSMYLHRATMQVAQIKQAVAEGRPPLPLINNLSGSSNDSTNSSPQPTGNSSSSSTALLPDSSGSELTPAPIDLFAGLQLVLLLPRDVRALLGWAGSAAAAINALICAAKLDGGSGWQGLMAALLGGEAVQRATPGNQQCPVLYCVLANLTPCDALPACVNGIVKASCVYTFVHAHISCHLSLVYVHACLTTCRVW